VRGGSRARSKEIVGSGLNRKGREGGGRGVRGERKKETGLEERSGGRKKIPLGKKIRKLKEGGGRKGCQPERKPGMLDQLRPGGR